MPTSRSAWLLAALLLAAGLPRPAARAPECAAPGEERAEQGHTVQVDCAGGPPLRGPARLLFGLALDANRADRGALAVLPGIGPARSAALVAERERRPFACFADLARVPGLGPRTLQRLAGQLRVEPVLPRAEKPIGCPEGRGTEP